MALAVPPATALHMGYSRLIRACQHYPAILLPLALSHLEWLGSSTRFHGWKLPQG
jgi:hypothetical protein